MSCAVSHELCMTLLHAASPCRCCSKRLAVVVAGIIRAIYSDTGSTSVFLSNAGITSMLFPGSSSMRMFLSGLVQVLITPALTFQVDVQKFCKRISTAEISLTMGYLIVFTIICFLGAPPLDPLNYFQFYRVSY